MVESRILKTFTENTALLHRIISTHQRLNYQGKMLSITSLLASSEVQNCTNHLFHTFMSAQDTVYNALNKIYGTSENTNSESARQALQRSCSIEDLILQIELQSQQPFVQTMGRLRDMFGEQWPPKASFDWPEQWLPYMEMADDMSYKLRDLDSPQLFREWMNGKGKEINVDKITGEIEEILAKEDHNSCVYGLMGALAKLIFAYRWGRLPATDQELNRKHLEFPAYLMKPFEKISEHYGTILRGCVFSTAYANSVFEDGFDGPRSIRFYFTTDELRDTETNFFNCFTHMDLEIGKALSLMRKYMALTDFARRAEPELSKYLLDDRVECLKEIATHMKTMFKIFREYINERKVKTEYWAPYIQGATAWDINGMTEGMSGAETFAFHVLDAFLLVKGTSAVYQASTKRLQTLPQVCRDLVTTLKKDMLDRFDLNCDLEGQVDPITEVKEEMLSSLHLWRLGHAKYPSKYFKSEYTATSGGVVENIGETEGTLVEIAERQLRQRVQETKECLDQATAKLRKQPNKT